MEVPGPIHVVIRDGRLDGPNVGHPILREYDEADPNAVYKPGDLVELPDGSQSVAIGSEWQVATTGMRQTVFVAQPGQGT